jgi:hypothetical protein
MGFLFYFQLLIGVIAKVTQINWFGRINYCPAAVGNKKADFRHFLNSSKLPIVASKSVHCPGHVAVHK